MSILEISNTNSDYYIDLNNGYYTFIFSNLTANISIYLADASLYDISAFYFFNKDNVYNVTIKPLSGSNIIAGNIVLYNNQYANLYSYNNNWYRF